MAKRPNAKRGKTASKRGAPSSDPDLVTRPVLAQTLGVNVRTVSKWQDDGLPVAVLGRGGRPSLFSLKAGQAFKAAREDHQKKAGLVDVAQERARRERAQAELIEQTHAVRAGKLLAAEELWPRLSGRIAAARTKLLAIPTGFAAQIAQAFNLEGQDGIERVVRMAIEDALAELSGMTPGPAGGRHAA